MKPFTIFMVDDSLMILSNLKRLLQHTKFRISGTAGSIDQALHWLSVNEVSIAIVDLHLPDGNGIEIVRWINSNKLGTEIIVLTNFASPQMAEEALKSGADKVFDKTREIDSLLDYLEAK